MCVLINCALFVCVRKIAYTRTYELSSFIAFLIYFILQGMVGSSMFVLKPYFKMKYVSSLGIDLPIVAGLAAI